MTQGGAQVTGAASAGSQAAARLLSLTLKRVAAAGQAPSLWGGAAEVPMQVSGQLMPGGVVRACLRP